MWGMASLLGPQRELYQPWLLLSLFVYFTPAFLTNNLEMMRLVPLLPILILVCAQGVLNFLGLFPNKKRSAVLILFLAGSCLIDAHQLFRVYPTYWDQNPAYYGDHKSPEFYRAYQTLCGLSDQKGKGWILLNFNPDPYDQTLFTATFDFNSAENPGLDSSDATWAALLVNTHEEPYLSKLFPEGKWEWLSKGFDRTDGGFILETLPLTTSNRERLDRWRKADLSLREVTYSMMEKGVDPNQGPLLKNLEKVYPFFQGDPLLESRYWRIRAVHHLVGGQDTEALGDYQKAIQKGLPQAHLYDEMGKLQWKMGRREEAKKSFEEAVSSRLNLTDAAQNIQVIERSSSPPSRNDIQGQASVSNQ
jgi:tetratricopeptide (TPR) repeat protein